MVESHVRHTSENLKSKVLKILHNYDISIDQIHTITSDNGQNMIKAVHILRNAYEDNLHDKNYVFNEEVFDDLKIGNISFIRCAAISCIWQSTIF